MQKTYARMPASRPKRGPNENRNAQHERTTANERQMLRTIRGERIVNTQKRQRTIHRPTFTPQQAHRRISVPNTTAPTETKQQPQIKTCDGKQTNVNNAHRGNATNHKKMHIQHYGGTCTKQPAMKCRNNCGNGTTTRTE